MAMAQPESGLESEELLDLRSRPASPWWQRKAVAAAASAALLLAAAAAVAYGTQADHGLIDAQSAQETIGLDMMSYTPPHDSCSKVTDNCLSTGCCKVAGMKCFKTAVAGVAKCMKKCPGCAEVSAHTVAVYEHPGLSFFCFSLYLKDTGSTKQSFELELIKGQKAKGVSIFRCAEQAVYSDVDAEIAPGLSTIKVTDVKGDWHFAKRKHTGTWVNTGIYFQVWKHIGEAAVWARHNYVIKVDITAVFFPNKLYDLLRNKPVPAEGVYYENCKDVEYGYFGNLEVFSKTAFGTLLANLDSCYSDSDIDWKVGIKKGKYGPMGEDLFAQKCMDKHGVKKVEDFSLTLDGSCPADRPKDQKKNRKYVPPCPGAKTATIHPLKKPDAYFTCLEVADQSMP